jgi:hypothetical protein
MVYIIRKQASKRQADDLGNEDASHRACIAVGAKVSASTPLQHKLYLHRTCTILIEAIRSGPVASTRISRFTSAAILLIHQRCNFTDSPALQFYRSYSEV